ncbi:MAG: DNA/RNA helicase domain-containing protein [Bacillota bacterium]
MLQGNKEFIMIDDQKVIYETALQLANEAVRTNTKQVLVVEGGPGTGKSVLAINLLVEQPIEVSFHSMLLRMPLQEISM